MKLRTIAATAAILLTAGALSACSLLPQPPANRDESGSIASSGAVDAFSLQVGDCLITSTSGSSVSELPAMPCTDPHDSEVFYIFDMPEGTFSQSAIDAAAKEKCAEEFVNYVGPNYETITSQGLDWFPLTPTSATWSQKHDREVDCIAYTVSEKNELTSSIKGLGA